MNSRGLFAFSLPIPIARRDFKPMRHQTQNVATVDAVEFNFNVNAWYINRQTLIDRLIDWQNRMYAAQNSLLPTIAQRLYTDLADLYNRVVLPGLAEWQWIYDYAATRGSTFRYCNEFIPEWRVLAQMPVFVVYTQQSTPYNEQLVDTVYHVHSSPAWIFESVCMQYLSLACAQLLGLLGCILGNEDASSFVRNALEFNKRLTDELLPCYFADVKGTDSFLLSEDFHGNYLRWHLQAQLDQVQALEYLKQQQENQHAPTISLRAAVMFSRSCRHLQLASKTFYDTASTAAPSTARQSNVSQNYTSLYNYVRACSHHMLAQFFWLCYECDLALYIDGCQTPLVFCTLPDDSEREVPPIDNRLLLMNAFYCARSALIQSAVAPTAARDLHEKICDTLQNFYQIAFPPSHRSAEGVMLPAQETETIETISCISERFKYNSVEVRHHCPPYIDLSSQKTFAISLRDTNDETMPQPTQ